MKASSIETRRSKNKLGKKAKCLLSEKEVNSEEKSHLHQQQSTSSAGCCFGFAGNRMHFDCHVSCDVIIYISREIWINIWLINYFHTHKSSSSMPFDRSKWPNAFVVTLQQAICCATRLNLKRYITNHDDDDDGPPLMSQMCQL